MVAFFRHFLVLVLVILQYISPLVHAHTHGNAVESGLHLYEFESLHIAKPQLSYTSAQLSWDSDSSIVNVGSCIKPACKHYQPFLFSLTTSPQTLLKNNSYQLIHFFSPLKPEIPTPLPYPYSSRAPPV
jgi:hypothetical protein